MSTVWGITFDPLLPNPWLVVLSILALVQIILGLIHLKRQSLTRLALYGFFLVLFLNPIFHKDVREPVSDVVVLAIDSSTSQELGDRQQQTNEITAHLREQLGKHDDIDIEIVTTRQDSQSLVTTSLGGGTNLMGAINEKLSDIAPTRLAAVIAITDGQVHDADRSALPNDLEAPFHVLLTGSRSDRDRRLVIKEVPKFGIVGKESLVRLRIDDFGDASEIPISFNIVPTRIKLNGDLVETRYLGTSEDHTIAIILPHRGESIVEIEVDPLDGELTEINNRAALQINGIRDRLRVLLVSGEPHAGERTWRNLLKADPSVDLVHFTILRPPEKQDGTPASELSLIAFPTRQLFAQKLNEFDLIIFDRFRRRGVLPIAYLANVARYVEDGGALLSAAGPSFASPFSLYRTPLAEVLPASPTGRTIEQGFRPAVSELGHRHPVTNALSGAPSNLQGHAEWGRWFRLIEVQKMSGETLLEGPEGAPLLILDHYGKGRIAQLLSDQAWLWTRGFEGGGPQAELLRRTAHWLMKEPELEEERLDVSLKGKNARITRHTLSDEADQVSVTLPSGRTQTTELEQTANGTWEGNFESSELGLHRVSDAELTTLIAIGPLNPKEFEEVRATKDKLEDLVKKTPGGIYWLETIGAPTLYDAKPGRRMATETRLGLRRNNQFTVSDVLERPMIPALLALILFGLLFAVTWRREAL